jgi:integrase
MKTNTTAKIVIFPQPTKKGFPLKIRIIQNRNPTYIGLKYFLTENQRQRYWNEKKKELKMSYPHFDAIQKEFDDELKKLGIVLKKEIEPKQVPINKLSFSQFYINYQAELKAQSQFGLLQKTNSVFLHLQQFCKEKNMPEDISFNDLNIDFLKAFKIYLIEKKLSAVTQRGYIEKIRSIINQAIKENKYNPERHPFIGFSFMPTKSKPKHLTPQEFNLLKSICFGEVKIIDNKNKHFINPFTQEMKKIGLMFCFQYYCFGMRVSDLLLLRWGNIYESGKRVRYEMYKTKRSIDIVLNNELLDILYQFFDYETRIRIYNQSKQTAGETNVDVDGVTIKINKKTERYDLIRNTLYLRSGDKAFMNKCIFSNLPTEISAKDLFSKISSLTSIYNKDLKSLSKALNLVSNYHFNLSTHMARHTFAYLSLISGQSIYYISQALNHKSIKTTETYLRGFESRELDNRFYNENMLVKDKKFVDDKLKELIANADYEQKRRIVELLGLK